MRKIKFRGFNIITKVMVDLKALTPMALHGSMVNENGLYLPFSENVALMQYTGLKDINGKEIYEGDILKVDGGLDDYYYVVEWVFAGFQLVTYKKAESDVLGRANAINNGYFEESEGVEVIGNIYENPELLNQG